jgi:hypothetical protein
LDWKAGNDESDANMQAADFHSKYMQKLASLKIK